MSVIKRQLSDTLFEEPPVKEKKYTEKQIKARSRQNFLLTFFDKDEYTEQEMNGFWLVKQWNGGSKQWQVAIYTQESYYNYKTKLI